jgi:hypothetical protein
MRLRLANMSAVPPSAAADHAAAPRSALSRAASESFAVDVATRSQQLFVFASHKAGMDSIDKERVNKVRLAWSRARLRACARPLCERVAHHAPCFTQRPSTRCPRIRHTSRMQSAAMRR